MTKNERMEKNIVRITHGMKIKSHHDAHPNVKRIYKSFNNPVCKNTSGTRGMCQRMKAVTMVAMSKLWRKTKRSKKTHKEKEKNEQVHENSECVARVKRVRANK